MTQVDPLAPAAAGGAPPARRHLSLAQAFGLAGGLVMAMAGLVVGLLVAARVEEAVVRNAANTTALYVQSFVAPLVQDLAQQADLPADDLAAIESLLRGTPLGQRIASFKIWQRGGLVIGASNPAIVGQTFTPTEGLRRAWGGTVQASFDDFDEGQAAEDQAEARLGVPLLEIYAPIRSTATGKVLSVIEFYEVASHLQSDLRRVLVTAWAVVAAVVLLVGASLFAIVLRGSRTIEAQIGALRDLSDRNVALRRKVQDSATRLAGQTDGVLRRIGADLHDGPAQQIGFVALRLDALRPHLAGNAAASAELAEIDRAVAEAITELRTISRGLSLPDIEKRPLAALVQGLVDAHAARSHTEVELTMQIDRDPPVPVKTVVCRTLQEGLSNAWRHGKGLGQGVALQVGGGRLRLVIRDRGPGPDPRVDPFRGPLQGLGLTGLQSRADALGGAIRFGPRADGPGAELVLELTMGEANDAD